MTQHYFRYIVHLDVSTLLRQHSTVVHTVVKQDSSHLHTVCVSMKRLCHSKVLRWSARSPHLSPIQCEISLDVNSDPGPVCQILRFSYNNCEPTCHRWPYNTCMTPVCTKPLLVSGPRETRDQLCVCVANCVTHLIWLCNQCNHHMTNQRFECNSICTTLFGCFLSVSIWTALYLFWLSLKTLA